jgi:hypothetical protein
VPPKEVTLPQMPTPYKVGAGPVTLDVVIGEKQKGLAKAWLKGRADPLGEGSPITSLKIGEGSELVGKTLEILTTVMVTNKKSTMTVVTYTLKGGESLPPIAVTHKAAGQNEVVEYAAEFLFTAGG